jgi:hypothetical protein
MCRIALSDGASSGLSETARSAPTTSNGGSVAPRKMTNPIQPKMIATGNRWITLAKKGRST